MQGLTVVGAALALLSTMIGAGLVGIPYAFYSAGIPLSLLISFVMTFQTINSCYLYFKAKDYSG